jgi:NADPH2:quinone reductase
VSATFRAFRVFDEGGNVRGRVVPAALADLSPGGVVIDASHTGKDGEHDFLRSLGASDVISRHGLQMGTRPMEKALWAGAVDVAGGEMLAWLTRTMMYNGAIASSGLTGGVDLKTTVLPFILRGVKLLGIDSAMCPMPTRLDVWRRLAADLRPKHLQTIATAIGLDDLPGAFATLLSGAAPGRHVVTV